MPNTDTSILVRMVLEGLVGLLVGILSWNVNAIKNDVEATIATTQNISVTIATIQARLDSFAREHAIFDSIQRRNSEMIIELRSQVNPRRVP